VHHQRRVGGRGDAPGGEVEHWQALELGDLLENVEFALELPGDLEELVVVLALTTSP